MILNWSPAMSAILISAVIKKCLAQSLGSRPMEFKSFGVAIKYGSFGSPVPPLYFADAAFDKIQTVLRIRMNRFITIVLLTNSPLILPYPKSSLYHSCQCPMEGMFVGTGTSGFHR